LSAVHFVQLVSQRRSLKGVTHFDSWCLTRVSKTESEGSHS
jgi:hypothetical protein